MNQVTFLDLVLACLILYRLLVQVTVVFFVISVVYREIDWGMKIDMNDPIFLWGQMFHLTPNQWGTWGKACSSYLFDTSNP